MLIEAKTTRICIHELNKIGKRSWCKKKRGFTTRGVRRRKRHGKTRGVKMQNKQNKTKGEKGRK